MEKHPNPFDEFLKETLKGHQMIPPKEAKKAFLEEASTVITSRKGWYNWYYIPILVVLISGILTVYYFRSNNAPSPAETITPENYISGQNQDTVDNNNSNNHNHSNLIAGTNSITTASSTSALTPIITATNGPATNAASFPTGRTRSEDVSPEANSEDIPIDNPSFTPSLAIVDADSDSAKAAHTGAPVISELKDTLSSQTTSSRLVLDLPAKPGETKTDTVPNDLAAKTDTTSALDPRDNPKPVKPAREKPVNTFATAVYYMPEWIFNTLDGNNYISSFGAEGIYYRGPFSLRTGIGIAISNDINKLAVEYNNYLGSYSRLDSIAFTYNEPAHNFIPNYYMSSEKVWDTLGRLDYPEMKMRYTYMRIPLVFGYDFWQEGRFSAGVRIGTTLSLLLNSKQLSEDYDPGENKVVNVYDISPDYVSVNWQVTGGLNASVRLAKEIWFDLEPTAKYFYNSIYENPGSTAAPWSVGIRTAILYKF